MGEALVSTDHGHAPGRNQDPDLVWPALGEQVAALVARGGCCTLAGTGAVGSSTASWLALIR